MDWSYFLFPFPFPHVFTIYEVAYFGGPSIIELLL